MFSITQSTSQIPLSRLCAVKSGKAAHMEAGVAYGLKKKMVLIGEVENPETLYLMFTEHYPDIESFLLSI